jgi:hypothetical protein
LGLLTDIMKPVKFGKEEVKWSLFTENVILHIKNFKDFIKNSE